MPSRRSTGRTGERAPHRPACIVAHAAYFARPSAAAAGDRGPPSRSPCSSRRMTSLHGGASQMSMPASRILLLRCRAHTGWRRPSARIRARTARCRSDRPRPAGARKHGADQRSLRRSIAPLPGKQSASLLQPDARQRQVSQSRAVQRRVAVALLRPCDHGWMPWHPPRGHVIESDRTSEATDSASTRRCAAGRRPRPPRGRHFITPGPPRRIAAISWTRRAAATRTASERDDDGSHLGQSHSQNALRAGRPARPSSATGSPHPLLRVAHPAPYLDCSSVTFTHRPWNHSAQLSHCIMNAPSSRCAWRRRGSSADERSTQPARAHAHARTQTFRQRQ